MNQIEWQAKKVIDAHVHNREKQPLDHFIKILDLVNYNRVCILSSPGYENIKHKNDKPGDTYIFGMLNQKPEKIDAGDGAYLVDEVNKMIELRYDGIKMMDGKPVTRRRWQPLGVNHPYFSDYWKYVEEIKIPITIHCVDPLGYWSPGHPDDYRDLGTQEDFFQQPLEVMERHPNLQINFAHFFFMGPNLQRLGKLFDRYPNMHVDMAMGQEFLYYMSDNPDASREFCIKYADRIMYGTDISENNSLKHAWAKAETLRLFLETDEEFDNLVYEAMGQEKQPGTNGRMKLRGLKLPQNVLDKIMWKNFEAFAGANPNPLIS